MTSQRLRHRAERLKALLRCAIDPDEQYKHWPPLFGTSSYWAWRRMTRGTPAGNATLKHTSTSSERLKT
jgi:hypothetical protein